MNQDSNKKDDTQKLSPFEEKMIRFLDFKLNKFIPFYKYAEDWLFEFFIVLVIVIACLYLKFT